MMETKLLVAMAKAQYRNALGDGADEDWPEMQELLAVIREHDPEYSA